MGGVSPGPWLLAVILTALLCLQAAAGCLDRATETETDDAGEDPPDPALLAFYEGLAAGREVRFETSHGVMRVLLYEEWMPTTTARFAALVDDGFYDGTDIHRIVPRFVIQGGDPSGTGLLGSGETIPHETDPRLLFGAGALGLARDVDPDSGDSQWFLTLTPQPHLSDPASSTAEVFGTYALYGQLIEGMDVAREISRTMTIPGLDRPIDAPRVESATLLPPPGDTDLLLLPSTIQPRAQIGAMPYDLEHPYHLFAGSDFPVAVHLRPSDDGPSPPAEISVGFEAQHRASTGDEVLLRERAVLRAAEHDPWSFIGSARLPEPGTWRTQVHTMSSDGPVHEFVVLPWHEGYARFGGSS